MSRGFFVPGAFLLALAVSAPALLLLPAAPALAAPLEIKQVRRSGERLRVEQRMTMDGSVDVVMGELKQTAPMYQETALVLDSEVTQLRGDRVAAERCTVQSIAQRSKNPETGALVDQFVGGQGTVFVVERDEKGDETAVRAESNAAQVPQELLDDAADSDMPHPSDFGIAGPVEVGSSWTFELPGFFGEDGKATGTATLKELAQGGGERRAVLELKVSMAEQDPSGGGSVTAEMSGRAEFDLATGQCRRLSLAGPMKMEAHGEGMSFAGGGQLAMEGSWTPLGGGGGPAGGAKGKKAGGGGKGK
jgi:hypothetical protein